MAATRSTRRGASLLAAGKHATPKRPTTRQGGKGASTASSGRVEKMGAAANTARAVRPRKGPEIKEPEAASASRQRPRKKPSATAAATTDTNAQDADGATPPPPPRNRLAEPHRTNAPLISPQTSRVVALSEDLVKASPSLSKLSRSTTSTNEILREACAHLIKVDPGLKPLIDKHHCHTFSPAGLAEKTDPFQALTSGIIAQQVSGAAAKAIKTRFIALFNDVHPNVTEETAHVFPTPSQVAACEMSRLRSAGLSGRKAEYIQGLAEKFTNGDLTTDMLLKASNEEVLERLTAVRGLGRWSVEMFAFFGLKRLDVFSTGDLGVQRGLAAYTGKDVSKLKARGGGKWKYMSEKDMLEHSAKFAPYRSLFMWYMWRFENVDVDAVQNSSAT